MKRESLSPQMEQLVFPSAEANDPELHEEQAVAPELIVNVPTEHLSQLD